MITSSVPKRPIVTPIAHCIGLHGNFKPSGALVYGLEIIVGDVRVGDILSTKVKKHKSCVKSPDVRWNKQSKRRRCFVHFHICLNVFKTNYLLKKKVFFTYFFYHQKVTSVFSRVKSLDLMLECRSARHIWLPICFKIQRLFFYRPPWRRSHQFCSTVKNLIFQKSVTEL